MSLKHTIKETDDTIILNLDIKILTQLPLKEAMKTLEILEYNNKTTGYYVEFTKEVQEFIDSNKNSYNESVKNENAAFKELSNIYFESFKGPLYAYADRLLENISKVYNLEKHFDNNIESINIPKITYKFEKEDFSDKFLLNVKNINELNEQFGKAAILHSLILFKDNLNYEHQLKNKSTEILYELSSNIKKACFDEAINDHPHMPSFEGKNYSLTQKFDDQCRTISSPEEILKLVLIREEVRQHVAKENKKTLKM